MFQFTETQKFKQWWVWLIIILAACIPLVSLLVQLDEDMKPLSDWEFLIMSVLMPLVIMSVFLMLKLKTRIDESGVHYQFYPAHLKEKTILWEEIAFAEVRQYSPIKEYGGWGIRQSFKNGKAFNVQGNVGLQLVLKDGKRILIGTQKREELELVLGDLKKTKL